MNKRKVWLSSVKQIPVRKTCAKVTKIFQPQHFCSKKLLITFAKMPQKLLHPRHKEKNEGSFKY